MGLFPMKKLKQRKAMLAKAACAAALMTFGAHFARDGATHVGRGAWLYGGEDPGTGGAIATDEHWEIISERQFKRNCYVAAGLFFVTGALLTWDVIKLWKERNELERSWERVISNAANVQEIRKHPENYRDNFKRWIKDNHPHLFS